MLWASVYETLHQASYLDDFICPVMWTLYLSPYYSQGRRGAESWCWTSSEAHPQTVRGKEKLTAWEDPIKPQGRE